MINGSTSIYGTNFFYSTNHSLVLDVNGVIKDHKYAWDEFNMRKLNLYGYSQIYYSCIYAFGERDEVL